MSAAERAKAIRELMLAASTVFDLCGNGALTDDPRLASKLVMFGTQEGARTRLVIDFAEPLPTISGEMVRNVDVSNGTVRMERVEMFAVHAAPADAAELH